MLLNSGHKVYRIYWLRAFLCISIVWFCDSSCICTAKLIAYEFYFQEILLTGHHRNITALRFVMLNSKEVSLVTASSDYIIIWHLNEVISSYNYGKQHLQL